MTVARVANNPITRLQVNFAAGLIAGTTPTTGKEKRSRNAGKLTVLAVLQAMMTIARGCLF
ncbi:hypothetical protein XBKQ1_1110043 [Xenorhabdus bovienii str. kraussei Quebec]|uniref:Uncharacterized protein n=1 Tax=Xenorhabdus bovienii str. kraussei Quebec TaxID=1398203 RepID=A0A077PBH4_XENBV|nr:hypothetical protein XBKQ1_1110043 [Xenorhabdus bovienii str. kraussei Quebec]